MKERMRDISKTKPNFFGNMSPIIEMLKATIKTVKIVVKLGNTASPSSIRLENHLK